MSMDFNKGLRPYKCGDEINIKEVILHKLYNFWRFGDFMENMLGELW
jgi:hypothetical protein